jgi:hypothetical protein
MTRNNSDWTYDDLRSAEVVPAHSGDGSYLVRLGENEYVSIPNTGLTTLALHDDVFDSFDGNGSVELGSGIPGIPIEVNVDFDSDEVTLTRDGDTARIPSEKHDNVFYAVYERDSARLVDIFEDHYTPTVRQGVMDWFMPRFRQDDDIHKTDDGWLLDGEVLVRWDGSNEVADPDLDTHVVRGGSTQQQDVGREALDVSMATMPDGRSFEAETPSGRTVELDETEARFLTTVGLWFDRNASLYDDDLYRMVERSSVDAFTDPKSGIRHGHEISKHCIQDLGVTDEAADKLWYSHMDHAALWEMAVRRGEFEDAPIDVFEDAANDDPDKWDAIESTKQNAPVPQSVKGDINERYD